MIRAVLVWWGLIAVLGSCSRSGTESVGASAPTNTRTATSLMPQLGHASLVHAIDFAADGARAVTASQDGSAAIWDLGTLNQLYRLAGHSGPLTDVTFLDDATLVVTTGRDGKVMVWHAHSGRRLSALDFHEQVVTDLDAASEGRRFATASLDGRAALWEAGRDSPVHVLEGHASGVTSVDLSTDGTIVLTTGDDGVAIVWDAAKGKERRRLKGHEAAINAGALSPDGTRAATVAGDGSVVLWDVETGTPTRTRGHGLRTRSVEFSRDGTQIVTASEDRLAKVWDAATGTLLADLGRHGTITRTAAFSGDGRRVVTTDGVGVIRIWDLETPDRPLHELGPGAASNAGFINGEPFLYAADNDGRVRLWSAEEGRPIAELRGAVRWITRASFLGDGTRIWAADTRGDVLHWDLRDGRLEDRIDVHPLQTVDAQLSADETFYATGGADGTLTVTELPSGERRFRVQAHNGQVTSVDRSPDGRLLLATSDEWKATLWDAETGDRVHELDGHGGSIYDGGFTGDGRHVVTGSFDRTAIVWDVATGERRHRLRGHRAPIVHLAFLGETRVLTASLDGRAILWDAGTGTELQRFEHGAPINFATFSSDGSRMALGGTNRRVTLWDATTGAQADELVGHGEEVTFLAFSPDDRRLVTVGRERTALLWDAETGKLLRALTGHAGDVTWADFSGASRVLLTSGGDGTLRLWKTSDGTPLVTLIPFLDGSWAVTDEAGRYDATNDGSVDGLVWVIDDEPYELTQLKRRYYDPGLLPKALALRDEPLLSVPPLGETGPPARIHMGEPDPGGAIEIRLENRGGGIGPLFATLNGSDISAKLLDQCPELDQETPCTADLSRLPTWKTGEPNEVFAVVGNADNSLAARGLLRAVRADGETRLAEPVDLWVLAIGTSDYASPELDLRFAAEDAVSFGRALRLAGTNGFGAEHTNVRVLTSPAREDSDGVPTRTAVDDAFEWLQQADPYDTVVVFFAGHGAAFSDDGELDDYFYMLPDARDVTDLRDPSLRALRSYSGNDLAAALSDVGALKRVVILDTCESGKAIEALGEVRELSADAIRAHVRARDRTGAWFLAGAAADKPSYEATRFGQGILTYALLEAMVGPALEADQIMVSRVFDHVGRQVPIYAEGVGGVQEPFLRPGNDTFPLGALPVDVRRRIELAKSRPVFIRTSVLAEGGAPDREGVSTAIDRGLRRLADGFRAPIVVFDAAAFPGGWQVTGQYLQADEDIVLKAFLSQDVDAEPIVVEVRGADPEAVGTALTEELKALLVAGGGALSAPRRE